MAATGPSGSKSASLTSVLSRTQGFLRRHLWVWPLLTAGILAFVGLWVRDRMEGAMKTQIADNLRTILAANTEALRAWAQTMKHQAQHWAGDDRVRAWVGSLSEVSRSQASPQAALLNAPQHAAMRAFLNPTVQKLGFTGYVVLDTNFLVLSSGREQLVGTQSPPWYASPLQACLEGAAQVTPPFPSITLLPDGRDQLRAGLPTMFAAAPIRMPDAPPDGPVVGILGLRIDPERDFTRILATAHSGESGETYAFNGQGLMLSRSRFEDELKRLGLIPDTEEAQSILGLELRDPLVDLSRGRASPKRRSEWPLTRAVGEAIAGRPGFDVKGYRDYVGSTVVGAWTWLPDFGFGLASEIDASEAFGPLHIMRLGFGFIFALLVLGAGAIFLLMRLANRFQESARQAALKARQLGQYALEEKIGAGAFGTVYRGHHALMRRPVAVKLLDAAQATETSIARFEREVQLTCQLTHPNTIALYDFGRTPEGLFYYAMEFLDGLSLDALVHKYGRLPEGRVIHILRQVCASLAEAHGLGLVHRDIKPHNIFLTRRGGVPDFVKVLDFGLVKARHLEGQVELTGANATLGTPLYMSPEAVEHPDRVNALSDLYSLGAVGYYLVTGQTVFPGTTIGEVLMQQVRAQPVKPSDRLGQPLSADFEALIMKCLAKEPDRRPGSARELEEALAQCSAAGRWDRDQSRDWWRRFDAAHTEQTMVSTEPQPQPQPQPLLNRFLPACLSGAAPDLG